MHMTRYLPYKTPLFLGLVIFSNLAGDVCFRFGLRHAGALFLKSPQAYLQAAMTPWVGFGIAFYLACTLAQMILLSWADLSYVLPVTSIGYALAALAGWLLLEEVIPPTRWIGLTFITFGVLLVSLTRPCNTGRNQKL